MEREDSHVKMEVEIGVRLLEAKVYQPLLRITRNSGEA
jgi:hypothetical protein